MLGAGGDQGREINAQQACSQRCHGHRHPELELDSEEQEPAGAPNGAGGGNEGSAVPIPRHNSACVTSYHLADCYYCQRQRHEPQAHVVCMDHIGDEEGDHCPKDDAVGEIDRQGHLEETQDDKGPIPGENDKVANPLPAVSREQKSVGNKAQRTQQTRGDESKSPSAPVRQQGNGRHTDHRCQHANGQ